MNIYYMDLPLRAMSLVLASNDIALMLKPCASSWLSRLAFSSRSVSTFILEDVGNQQTVEKSRIQSLL